MNSFTIWMNGKERLVSFSLSRYGKTRNLYVGLMDVSDSESIVPCYDITSRFAKLPDFIGALNEDYEGMGEILEMLGAGNLTGRIFRTNIREYREFKFDPEFFMENCPEQYGFLISMK